jgi:hypothetical protein
VASGRAAETSEWMQAEHFKTSRHKGRSERKVLVVRTDDAWTVERLDEISCLPNGCKGTDQYVLNSAQSLLEAHN